MPTARSRVRIAGPAALALLALAAVAQAAPAPEFRFQKADVLGTSYDLVVRAPDRPAAQAAHQAALAEIERLRRLLSTWDPASEISRLAAAAGPVKASPELLDVLEACEARRSLSGGAFNANLGGLVALWKAAQKADRLPDAAALAAEAQRIAAPAWTIDRAASTVTPLAPLHLNVDALAKGYIMDKAVAAVRAKVPAVAALVLDIGGDVLVWAGPKDTAAPWADVDVADPAHAADNAPPLARVRLASGAVCSSGHYARHYTIGGRAYSHILDPRTGRPVDAVAGATVVAPEAATADALATILCVLPPEQGLKALDAVPGAQALIVGADATRHASPGWNALQVPLPERPSPPVAADPPAAGPWPAGRALTVALTLAPQKHRPYVVIWVQDAAGRPVKTLALWGAERKYIVKLTEWYGLMRDRMDAAKAVTRASRAAGRYDLVWDGRDDLGRPVAAGVYTVRIETAREKGPHTSLQGQILCGTDPAAVRIDGNSEVAEAMLTCAPAAPEGARAAAPAP